LGGRRARHFGKERLRRRWQRDREEKGGKKNVLEEKSLLRKKARV